MSNRSNIITQSDSERTDIRRSDIATSNPARPQQYDDSTLIRRTLVERGLRPVSEDGRTVGHQSTATSITTITKQHQEEQRELQELNAKFAVYLDRVHYLESHNQQLSTNLTNLKQSWGGDAAQLHAVYDPQLKALREQIDAAIRDRAYQELQLKRHEYDLWQIQQQIATFEDNNDINRLNQLKQELDGTSVELEHLRNLCDQRLTDLTRQRSIMEDLLKELDGLKNELDNQQLERIVIENELQTLREHAAFQEAIHLAQRNELVTLSTPVLDVSGFYRAELARAISDIRQDFEVLSHQQVNELEEYYNIKTEQVRAEIESENERKRVLASEGVIESMDKTHLTSSLRENQTTFYSLQEENRQLQSQLDAIIEDLEKIEGEHSRERQAYDQEFAQLQQTIADKQDGIDSMLENNISLRFELSTYGRLLHVEEQHLNRMEQQQQNLPLTSSSLGSSSSTAPSSYPNDQPLDRVPSDLATKKMTVQKTARGPISFDSVDLELDSVILVNEKYSGSEQSFQKWVIRRQVDQQPEIVYQFPSIFSLRPRQTIRILSKRSPNAARPTGDTLIADKIDTWGIGRKMVTRLIDDHNEEKAIITQIFQ
ncbi:unnamed protein product [Adineta steineri]|uniref:LTD domain-containing protein n=1 Tax=Adineta steineri TaxID=433720 RepID=A0A814B3F1_9BILA|nr:unnamed protein product [Adineta steineri]CAF3861779.1 unnamed protein product [Adineta steineri]